MEGLNVENRQPVAEKEAASPETKKEKEERAQVNVRKMFNEKMETVGTITSFEHPRN